MQREERENGFARLTYGKVVGPIRPGLSFTVLWLQVSGYDFFSTRLLMFIGLPFGMLLRSGYIWVRCSDIPLEHRINEFLAIPWRIFKFIVLGKSAGLLRMVW